MNSKEVMKAAIVVTIAISAPIVLLCIHSFQTTRAQNSSDSVGFEEGISLCSD